MDRYAIFVDAGYFFAAGAQAAFGSYTPRKQVALKSPENMLAGLHAKASAMTDQLPLLRTYWYDAMPSQHLTVEQSALARLAGVKLRLGALNIVGEQKGVDSLIVTDLIELAHNRAIADAVLVSGDEDLRIAVQVAQTFGVRVHIIAASEPSANVSLALLQEADSISALDGEWFSSHMTKQNLTKPNITGASASLSSEPAVVGIKTEEEISIAAKEVVEETLDTLPVQTLQQLAELFAKQQSVPPEFDRPLIRKVSMKLFDYQFSGNEMRQIRGQFVRAVKAMAANLGMVSDHSVDNVAEDAAEEKPA